MTNARSIEDKVRSLAPGRARTSAFMGWRPDLPDIRDRPFRYRVAQPDAPLAAFPTRAMDKRIHRQPVFDQRMIGSCTGQSVSILHAIERGVTPRSPLFAYWHARAMIGETDRDDGAYIRDAIKVTNVEGLPRDDLWPDVDSNVFLPPTVKAETDAEKRKVFNYHALEDAHSYRACLAAGHCFVIGFTVYGNFWETGYNGGLAPMPAGRPDGGHAVIVYGYDDDWAGTPQAAHFRQRGLTPPPSVYFIRNSWGKEWGVGGDFIMPSAFLDDPDLAGDAWTIRKK